MSTVYSKASLAEVILFLIIAALLGSILLNNLRTIPEIAGNLSTVTIYANVSSSSDVYQSALNQSAAISLSILKQLTPYVANTLFIALLIIIGVITYVFATTRRQPY